MNGIPEYAAAVAVAVLVVVVLDLLVVRTRLMLTLRFWLTMAICLGFQILVDGWLTKLSAPIVLYDNAQTIGVRAPWDIPVEDFAFGFAMITLVLMVWSRLTDRTPQGRRAGHVAAEPDRP